MKNICTILALLSLTPVAQARLEQVRTYTTQELYSKEDQNRDWSLKTTFNFVVANNSQWSKIDLLPHIKKAVNIFKVCDLKIEEAVIWKNDLPSKLSENDETAMNIMMNTGIPERPLMFLMKKTNKGLTGHAYSPYKNGNSGLSGTAWIPEEILSSSYLSNRNPEYSTIAHEFGHLLFNVGHHTSPGLMSDGPEKLTGNPGKVNCRRLEKSEYVVRLR